MRSRHSVKAQSGPQGPMHIGRDLEDVLGSSSECDGARPVHQRQRGGSDCLTVRRRELIAGVCGSMIAFPLAGASGQEGKQKQRVGVLLAFEEKDPRANGWLSRFTEELSALGWIVGRNLQVDVRWTSADVDRMHQLAQELVRLQPDVILSFGTPVTAALQRETNRIPIVFAIVSDPVGEGFAASLHRPGGNITGFTNSEGSIGGKWLQLLTQIAPGIKRVSMIFNPDTSPGGGNYYMPHFEAAARILNILPNAAPVHNIAEIEAVVADLGQERGGGFIAMADFFLFINRAPLIALAAKNNVPAIYPWREVPTAGGFNVVRPRS